MEIIFDIEAPFQAGVETKPIENALQTALDFFNQTFDPSPHPARSVTIVVTDNDTIRQLNAQYRGFDTPTDVLSFENSPDPDFPAPDEASQGHLGDIVISYPLAQAQAGAAGHSTPAEITLLAVHGFLHLLGYDHDTPANKQRMWAAQRQVMAAVGLAHVQPTEA